MNNLFDMLDKYYNGLPDYRKGQKQFIIGFIERLKSDDDTIKNAFEIIRRNCDRFPSEKQLWELFKDKKTMFKKVTYNYNNPAKTEQWNGIKLFPFNFDEGMNCLICGSPKDRANCYIVEKEDGYDKTMKCPCCGNDPHLSLLEEWKAFVSREGLVSYQVFYWFIKTKESMKRELRENEALKLKEMEE